MTQTETDSEDNQLSQITYTYDANGNILTRNITDTDTNSTKHINSTYSYNLANMCVNEFHDNGSGYDYSYIYTYTPDGNIVQTNSWWYRNQRIINYEYDKLNRLTSEEQIEYTNNKILTSRFKDEYSFDDYNNIVEKVHTDLNSYNDKTVTSTYNKTRLATQTETDSDNNQLSQTNYTYDDNGNMTAKARVVDQNTTTTAFSYDALDRTESIGNTAFAYDCDGNRIAKNTTETVWNNGEVSADLIGDTVKVFTEDNSVYCENGEFTFNAIDSKGDVVATTSSYFGDYTYDAYGNDLYNTNTTNPIGYRGYYFDSETGLYYLKARYYDSTTGQFTQEDTVQDDNLQYNLYGYCSGNPVLYVDPSGNKKWYKTFKAYKKGLSRGDSGLSLSHYLDVYKEYKYNVEYIKTHKPKANKKYIYDQYSDNVCGLHYGNQNFSYNGCEIAAVYNFLRYSKKKPKIQHIIKQFSLNGLRWFDGDWGTDPNDIKKYFDGNGIKYTYIKDSGQASRYVFDKGIKDNKICIVSCWDMFDSWKIHTFAFYKKNKKYYAYNGYGSELMTGIKKYNSFVEMTKNNIFICGYYSW